MPTDYTDSTTPKVQKRGQRTNIVLFVIGVLWPVTSLRTFLFPPYDRDAL
jgi:hypothetical protein